MKNAVGLGIQSPTEICGVQFAVRKEIFAAQRWLASNEGLFVEPASAASVAGLFKCRSATACASGSVAKIPDDAVVVCTLTGHGLKDTAAVLNDCVQPISAPTDKAAILSILGRAK